MDHGRSDDRDNRAAPAARTVHLVHVNDTDGATPDAWARLARVVRGLRAAGRCDILLHAGDVDLGAPSGAPAAILARLRVDAVALGNHDLDRGVGALAADAAALRGTLLCANAAGLPDGCARPYRVLRRGGLRVAVLGLTLGDLAAHQPERHLGEAAFLDPAAALRRLVPRLRARADVVVVLSHCGYGTDRALAAGLEGPAIVVGGHSHRLLPTPERAGPGWVVQAGDGAAHVGWVEVAWRPDGLDVRGGVVPTAGAAPDRAVARLAAMARVPGDDAVIAYAATELSAGLDPEKPLANLVADLVRAHAGTEVALLRCAAVRGDVATGPLTRAELRRLNTNGADLIARLVLTGAELRAVLECGALDPYFLLTLSGGRVVYDLGRPAGRRVAELRVGAAPLDPARRYTVACSEYLARGISVFTPLRGKPFETLPASVQDVLEARVAVDSTLAPVRDGRLVVRGRT